MLDITDNALELTVLQAAQLEASGWWSDRDGSWLMEELQYAADAGEEDAKGFLDSMSCLVAGNFEARWCVGVDAGAFGRWLKLYGEWARNREDARI